MQASKQLALVALGGSLGAMARYLLASWMQRALPAAGFPFGTLLVNALGCLGIGLLAGLAESRQAALGPALRAFAMVGILGGFTTFSTFAHETLALARDADWERAFSNVASQVVLGLGTCWLGYALARNTG